MNDKKKKFENIYEQISFPKDWDPTSLSDVFDLRRETMVPTGIGNQRYIGLEHIDSGRMKISRYGVESEIRSAKNKFYPDDILYGKLRPYLDKSVLADIEGICSTDILVFKVDKERILPRFGACLVHTSAFLQYVISTTTGVNHPRTSWSSIGKFRCSIPKLAEQSIIVHALFILQQAIEHQEKIIEKTKELKRSLMHRLFTYGLRGEELKETEIGLMPESWNLVSIGELIANKVLFIQNGFPCGKWNDKGIGILQLRPFNISDEGYIDLNTVKHIQTDKKIDSYLLRNEDVIFNNTNSEELVGKTALWQAEKEAVLSNHMTIIRILKKDKLVPLYLARLLHKKWFDKYFRSICQRHVNQASVGIEKIKGVKLGLPSIAEQKEIASVFYQLDQKICNENIKKMNLESFFKSMLQLLMTGQVRVKDIDFGEINV